MNRIFCLSAACVLMATGVSGAKDPSPAEIRNLVQNLDSADADERLNALFALALSGAEPARVVSLLTAALSHERQSVRARAAAALAECAPLSREAAPKLREILRSDDLDTRAAAGHALARLGGDADSVVPVLLDVMRVHRQRASSDRSVLFHAHSGVTAYGASAVPAFRAALKNETLRDAAVQSLADLGDTAEPLVPEIVQLLKEGAVDGSQGGKLLARYGQPAAGRVVALLKENEAIADRAMAALSEFGEDAAPDLALALQEGAPAVRRRAGEIVYFQCCMSRRTWSKAAQVGPVIPGLARLADDADLEVRRKAVVTLCQLGEAGAPEVLRALRDGNVGLRLAACEAIGGLGAQAPDTVRLPLVERLDDADPLIRVEAAEALLSLQPASPRLVPILLAGLWDNRGDVRFRALLVVYHMRGEDAQFAAGALPHLRWFDTDRRVRRMAARIIRRMEEEGRQ